MALSIDEWRDALIKSLDERQPIHKLYRDYYNGDHRLAYATSKFREAFGELFEAFADNWCGLVVDVAVERLEVQGFRFGEDDADEDAWKMWQANGLDAGQIMLHEEAIKVGTSYLMVGPPRKVNGEYVGEPVITVESPEECITASNPSNRRERLAGLKRYRDVNGDVICQVFTPERIATWKKRSHIEALQVLGVVIPGVAGAGGDWELVSDDPNPVEVVPLIPVENAPNLLTGGTSDLQPAIALNDAANKFFTDMIHASEYTSFPQRVVTGVEIPRDPVTQEPLPDEQLRAAVNRLWAFEDPAAKVHQLNPGELGQYVEGVEMSVQHLAAQTRTPPHVLLTKLVNISGDALIAAETGLVFRCVRKTTDFSDPHEDTQRVAFKWKAVTGSSADKARDLERAEMTEAETIWKDPERKDPIVLSQSLTMKAAVGVPQEILWEEAGYTPQQIKRMKELREAEEQKAMEQQREQLKMQQEFAPKPDPADPKRNGGDPVKPRARA